MSESQDRTQLGRAFDELMAGAVPADARRSASGPGLATLPARDVDISDEAVTGATDPS